MQKELFMVQFSDCFETKCIVALRKVYDITASNSVSVVFAVADRLAKDIKRPPAYLFTLILLRFGVYLLIFRQT